MIRKRAISYTIIMIFMIMCTMSNSLDFSSTFSIDKDIYLQANIFMSILFGLAISLTLFFISKQKINGDGVKILYQLISYFSISIGFIMWTLHMNLSLLIMYGYDPTLEFVKGFYRNIFMSQFYALISAVFMKSISISTNKDLKNEI